MDPLENIQSTWQSLRDGVLSKNTLGFSEATKLIRDVGALQKQIEQAQTKPLTLEQKEALTKINNKTLTLKEYISKINNPVKGITNAYGSPSLKLDLDKEIQDLKDKLND